MTLPHTLLGIASAVADLLAALGCVQALVGAGLVRRFGRGVTPVASMPGLPEVTVMKPLHGDEPLLEAALASFCEQDYPQMQIVFGVQSRTDPAIALVRRLQDRFPSVEIDLVVDTTRHGANGKIANLINMLPMARHGLLVVSDSDIHAEPSYLRRVVGALGRPGIGLVTTLYSGRPATGSLSRRLGAGQVNHNFMPGVLMSRLLGRQDCLGATMALRRGTLEAIGGLQALSAHIADDSALGQLVRRSGQSIAIADTLTATTIGETSLRDLFSHELRWGRTVCSVEPLGYTASAIQLPLFWATLPVLMMPVSVWSWSVLVLVWAIRAVTASTIDRVLGRGATLPVAWLPLRDWLSATVMLGSLTGRRVAWRGQTMHLPARVLQPLHSGADAGD